MGKESRSIESMGLCVSVVTRSRVPVIQMVMKIVELLQVQYHDRETGVFFLGGGVSVQRVKELFGCQP